MNKPAEISLTGSANFRDIRSSFEHAQIALAPQKIFRSGDLYNLSDRDLEVFKALNFGLICDLRSEIERQLRPSRFPAEASQQLLLGNISIDVRARQGSLLTILRDEPSVAGAQRAMLEIYRALPYVLAASFGDILQRMVEVDGPTLVHCTAGKDRTGFVCACLLRLVEADTSDIIADYLRTQEFLDKEHMATEIGALLAVMIGTEIPRDALDVINGVETDYLLAAFHAIDEGFGSFERYLRAIGVSEELHDRVRRHLAE